MSRAQRTNVYIAMCPNFLLKFRNTKSLLWKSIQARESRQKLSSKIMFLKLLVTAINIIVFKHYPSTYFYCLMQGICLILSKHFTLKLESQPLSKTLQKQSQLIVCSNLTHIISLLHKCNSNLHEIVELYTAYDRSNGTNWQ